MGLYILYFIVGLIAAGLFRLYSPPIGEEDYMLVALAFFFWPVFLLIGALWVVGRLLCFVMGWRG